MSQVQYMDNDSAQIDDWKDFDIDHPRLANSDEIFYVKWARESIKQTVPYLNDLLQKLITLISALFAASLVAIKENIIDKWFGIGGAFVLLVALGMAITGIWPRTKTLQLDCADQIKLAESNVSNRKSFWVQMTLVFLAISLLVFVFGFLALPPK
jgi:hypothetical protein